MIKEDDCLVFVVSEDKKVSQKYALLEGGNTFNFHSSVWLLLQQKVKSFTSVVFLLLKDVSKHLGIINIKFCDKNLSV